MSLNERKLDDKFQVLVLDQFDGGSNSNAFKLAPIIMDFLRKVTLYKGRVLFVESEPTNLIKECILIALNHIFRTTTYETYTLVKSQNLFFNIEPHRLANISRWDMNARKIRQYLSTFP